MMRFILALFGYVKVPKAAVQISMEIEESYRRISKTFPEIENFKMLYKGSKTMTDFLRSGRLISYGK